MSSFSNEDTRVNDYTKIEIEVKIFFRLINKRIMKHDKGEIWLLHKRDSNRNFTKDCQISRKKKKKCYCTTFMDNECSFPKKTLSYKY